uniref:C3H1-type domain-containing protein n=1 Tax=Chromera velia CCMP2878 TaxID=1169474 RepID=A0A0G4I638_9ALVE|eukprot:Cvel_11294.t1-p1 / transcript=Cvel_11294.t1 / gene=Cvel_11294 / organism=Chromera_velia_CCMP2878 / gene_product=hypothetical protein / transcript_product=hypothetical protein / location=Cvel_scaffold705:41961-46450(-) / protein_length=1212 / sequence_SO=supercontig / SO=protein_coding / is_pseudo=false
MSCDHFTEDAERHLYFELDGLKGFEDDPEKCKGALVTFEFAEELSGRQGGRLCAENIYVLSMEGCSQLGQITHWDLDKQQGVVRVCTNGAEVHVREKHLVGIPSPPPNPLRVVVKGASALSTTAEDLSEGSSGLEVRAVGAIVEYDSTEGFGFISPQSFPPECLAFSDDNNHVGISRAETAAHTTPPPDSPRRDASEGAPAPHESPHDGQSEKGESMVPGRGGDGSEGGEGGECPDEAEGRGEEVEEEDERGEEEAAQDTQNKSNPSLCQRPTEPRLTSSAETTHTPAQAARGLPDCPRPTTCENAACPSRHRKIVCEGIQGGIYSNQLQNTNGKRRALMGNFSLRLCLNFPRCPRGSCCNFAHTVSTASSRAAQSTGTPLHQKQAHGLPPDPPTQKSQTTSSSAPVGKNLPPSNLAAASLHLQQQQNASRPPLAHHHQRPNPPAVSPSTPTPIDTLLQGLRLREAQLHLQQQPPLTPHHQTAPSRPHNHIPPSLQQPPQGSLFTPSGGTHQMDLRACVSLGGGMHLQQPPAAPGGLHGSLFVTPPHPHAGTIGGPRADDSSAPPHAAHPRVLSVVVDGLSWIDSLGRNEKSLSTVIDFISSELPRKVQDGRDVCFPRGSRVLIHPDPVDGFRKGVPGFASDAALASHTIFLSDAEQRGWCVEKVPFTKVGSKGSVQWETVTREAAIGRAVSDLCISHTFENPAPLGGLFKQMHPRLSCEDVLLVSVEEKIVDILEASAPQRVYTWLVAPSDYPMPGDIRNWARQTERLLLFPLMSKKRGEQKRGAAGQAGGALNDAQWPHHPHHSQHQQESLSVSASLNQVLGIRVREGGREREREKGKERDRDGKGTRRRGETNGPHQTNQTQEASSPSPRASRRQRYLQVQQGGDANGNGSGVRGDAVSSSSSSQPLLGHAPPPVKYPHESPEGPRQSGPLRGGPGGQPKDKGRAKGGNGIPPHSSNGIPSDSPQARGGGSNRQTQKEKEKGGGEKGKGSSGGHVSSQMCRHSTDCRLYTCRYKHPPERPKPCPRVTNCAESSCSNIHKMLEIEGWGRVASNRLENTIGKRRKINSDSWQLRLCKKFGMQPSQCTQGADCPFAHPLPSVTHGGQPGGGGKGGSSKGHEGKGGGGGRQGRSKDHQHRQEAGHTDAQKSPVGGGGVGFPQGHDGPRGGMVRTLKGGLDDDGLDFDSFSEVAHSEGSPVRGRLPFNMAGRDI